MESGRRGNPPQTDCFARNNKGWLYAAGGGTAFFAFSTSLVYSRVTRS